MVFSKFTSAVALLALAASVSAAAVPRVDPDVHRTLRQQGAVNLIVTMRESTKTTLDSLQEGAFTSRGQFIANMVTRLEKAATTSQAGIMSLLAQEAAPGAQPLFSGEVKPFWIANAIYIPNASPALVEKLAAMPSVLEVAREQVLPLPQVTVVEANSTAPSAAEWGLTKIQATDVWASGNTGEGIIVSTIDTGVRGTHEALKGNFRGAYGWFDPEKKAAAPYDPQGHGTHTMGTIAGAGGIGVAPGATWMACKGCRTSGCPQADLLSCAQFITCPTDTNGANKDCSKAPHVVSNSWGGGQGNTFYQASVDAWQKAGIIPIFANGNSGPNCGTANSPGDYKNVIAVGATDVNDALANFSSKGPSKGGLLKPEISAPGANVRSSWMTDDTSYNTISGTSMATPHVSGVVALLLKANPGLTFDQVRTALINNVDTASLVAAGKTCGGTADGTFPNNNFGYGRVNALKVVGSGGSVPTPTTTAPAPVTPGPVTPAPVTPGPVTPTPDTPAPTTAKPNGCAARPQSSCSWFNGCRWDATAKVCKPLFG